MPLQAIAVLIAVTTQWMIAVSAAQAATVSEEQLSIPYNALISACNGESATLSGLESLRRLLGHERIAMSAYYALLGAKLAARKR
jgi:hypothetical protein